MTKDPARRYAIERCVWLYRRWMMAMDAGERRKASALGHRLTRGLTVLEPEDRPDYYQQINLLRVDALYDDRRTAAREELSRQAGYRVTAMAREAEAAEAAAGDEDE